jgi:bleomycin hydrolase
MKIFVALLLFILPAFLSSQSQPLNDAVRTAIAHSNAPKDVGEFTQAVHLTPINQDSTLVCWSFATLSFIESEMNRIGKEPVRLAVMYPVYNVFIEKASLFVNSKGKSRFAAGDLFTGAWETILKYGCVPQDTYPGKSVECSTYNQSRLYDELDLLMKKVSSEKRWDVQSVLTSVKNILEKHIGTPPTEFSYKGKKYTPVTFRDEVVNLPWNNYIKVMSFLYAPFNLFSDLRVPDNWVHDSTYFNVPIDVFYNGLREAVTKGYTAAVDADISEAAYRTGLGIAVIPGYDIPAKAISQEAREYRFFTELTTDDHLMHVVGIKSGEGNDWFLVKDSWRTSWNSNHPGYLFMDASYTKLKILAYLIHRDGVPQILQIVKGL